MGIAGSSIFGENCVYMCMQSGREGFLGNFEIWAVEGIIGLPKSCKICVDLLTACLFPCCVMNALFFLNSCIDVCQ